MLFRSQDVAGNVAEWVSDWFAPGYPKGPRTNPGGPERGTKRVVRGGSWSDSFDACAFTRRTPRRPDVGGNAIGVRVAFSLNPPIVEPLPAPPTARVEEVLVVDGHTYARLEGDVWVIGPQTPLQAGDRVVRPTGPALSNHKSASLKRTLRSVHFVQAIERVVR